ncbi:MAG: hypothetical protein IPL78_00585 [Chloroflexi bacterium]|nr:hypothetical protein [Chloroflexota bacterium]
MKWKLGAEPVRTGDLRQITRLVFANMTGVDQQFTAMTRHWLSRLYNQVTIPFYLLTSGWGYKVVRGGQIAGFAYLSLRRNPVTSSMSLWITRSGVWGGPHVNDLTWSKNPPAWSCLGHAASGCR